ncbi:Uma2 family endonuclease [Amycolatopsis sp. DG1A-15b]|uniref:Uma2 family endonuclease n=1 Tax=Amycolatopsis sp. DG1A-15b TaxID=3052846 RepID=UPI00255B6FCB|nr:Uma2 family endonuclease [Amycolatopsis sp. DG1A-15b]WIX85724.1 Uma2 family endonuclease [Amycolatopsis sp. DG1A-15b]
MTTLPDWLHLPPEGITAEAYEAMPEDVCRRIEVVDGGVVVVPAPTRSHQTFVRHLASLIEAAVGEDLAVVTGADLRLRDTPLLNRRPDVVVYDANVPDDQVLRPGDCTLVVEVMSVGSVITDQLDKLAEYAAAGIEHYWRVENYDDPDRRQVFRYITSPASGTYHPAAPGGHAVSTKSPFAIDLDLHDVARKL